MVFGRRRVFTRAGTVFMNYMVKEYNRSTEFVEYVKNYSKIFKNVCIAAKSLNISAKVKASENKIKTVWKIIKQDSASEKPRDCRFQLQCKNTLINSDMEVAAAFQDYFSNVARDTTREIRSSAMQAVHLLHASLEKSDSTFEFSYVTPRTIYKTFKSLSNKNTEDLWGMSVKSIGHIIEIITPYLCIIFNSCIDKGVFPNLMKYSKVIPLFKSGEKSNLQNFRPISILPVLSKIFEKIMLNQLQEHFTRNKLLHNRQFGFTKGRSTTDAASVLIKHIYNIWEESSDAVGIFCDLSKAFDCVEHLTLKLKLKHYGLSDAAINLISSYLSERTQTVVINETPSKSAAVKLGVPQGSILGPFLFLVYINDLPYIVKDHCEIVLFADDTSLIFKVSRNTEDYTDINSTMNIVSNWFTINNLLLNSKKTKWIRFTLPNVKVTSGSIFINNACLDMVDKTLFLGLTIDKDLQWSPHISSLANRLSSAAYAVKD